VIAKQVFAEANQSVERMLARRSKGGMLPDQPQWVAAAWKP
jgi:hypothetical protein